MFETQRLRLRCWNKNDRPAFVKMNQDPVVMQHFPDVYSPERSNSLVDKMTEHHRAHGFTVWALERKDTGQFIGFAGTVWIPYELAFTPAVEIAWRLESKHWNLGFATEAARKSLDVAFNQFDIKEVVAMTTPGNTASLRVMQKLGMSYNPNDDFDHPNVPEDSRLRRHVLYRLRKQDFA